jgi:alpha-amylase/alpha-mannosidase (GH57 family)
MEKFVCIHGHFYQPPRENPWLEFVELQDSAAPYHDWNERITAECYGRNAAARIFNPENRIERIVNNYSKISFNFGPTLLSWMRDRMPRVHDAIVAADKESREHFSSHGSALAQVYNHMILPLANPRDKYTQVFWGIRDFEFRFGRAPEGLWLSETAADTETLATLAQLGIKFTILSPFQAGKARDLGKRHWRELNGGRIDPTRPYRVRLPGKRSIVVFFYDAPISQAIAFEHLLESGEKLAQRLTSAFNDSRPWDQLVHIATDGESYGHHHRWGEMALAYALHFLESNKLANLTNYGEFLEKHPPAAEAQIHEKSAWSCAHGVGRWMANCGCNSGGHAGWNQQWREPLRNTLDWLRDELAPLFEKKAGEYLKDPWAARNEYIAVILDRSEESRNKYFAQQASRELKDADKVAVLKLMELQRHAMLMYTSCGWFFDELSGIETVQVIQYAGRAIQLARNLFERDLEAGFLDRLEAAKSNIAEHRDGRCIYEKFVKPGIVDWEKAVAHYAISSVFETYQPRERIFSFSFEERDRKVSEEGRAKLVIGTTTANSEITQEADTLSYAALYLGEHHLTAGVKRFDQDEAYQAMVTELQGSFTQADFSQTIRLIDRHFGHSTYSLKSLFKDEQRRVLRGILASMGEDLDGRYRSIAERYTPLMTFLRELGAPLPAPLQTAADFTLQADIRREFDSDQTNVERLRALLADAQARNQKLLDDDLAFTIKRKLEAMMSQLAQSPDDLELLQRLETSANIARSLPLELNLWHVRNLYWELLQNVFPQHRERAGQGDETAKNWVQHFIKFGDCLDFAVQHLQA